jgi:hypothetical protein
MLGHGLGEDHCRSSPVIVRGVPRGRCSGLDGRALSVRQARGALGARTQGNVQGREPWTRAAESTDHGTICRCTRSLARVWTGEKTGLSPAIPVSWPARGRVKRTPWLLGRFLIERIFAAGAQAVLPAVPTLELSTTAQTGRGSRIRAVFRGSAMGTFQGSCATHGGPSLVRRWLLTAHVI